MKAKCVRCGHEGDVPNYGATHRRCPGASMDADKKPTRPLRAKHAKLASYERGNWQSPSAPCFKTEEDAA